MLMCYKLRVLSTTNLEMVGSCYGTTWTLSRAVCCTIVLKDFMNVYTPVCNKTSHRNSLPPTPAEGAPKQGMLYTYVQIKLCIWLTRATHHKETLSILITETATKNANYVNHVHCTTYTIPYLTKSPLSKIQEQLYFNF
jgi:hypothetical protein